MEYYNPPSNVVLATFIAINACMSNSYVVHQKHFTVPLVKEIVKISDQFNLNNALNSVLTNRLTKRMELEIVQ